VSASAPNADHAGIVRLPAERAPEAVAVLCEAFHDYPVMRYFLGDRGARYDADLERMVGIFVSSRVVSGHPILAIEEQGRPVAIATITLPGEWAQPPEVQAAREALWAELDPGAKARADGLVDIWKRTALAVPQYHVNMLGVLRSHAGRGLGGRLLREVHEMSRLDPGSTGVSLTTEDPKNVPLYQHCGYEIVAHDRFGDEFETWGFFRRDDAARDR
jgi:GNAT superfamily N-acetyltransferase